MKMLGDFLCLLLVENQRINKLQYRSFERCAPFCGIYFMPVCHIVAHHSISNSLPNTDHLSLALINRS